MAERSRAVGLAEAKNHLSALTNEANATGRSFVIYKNNQPWVEVRPLSVRVPRDASGQTEPISIVPVRHEVKVANLDQLFADYDGSYRPQEDGFAGSIGKEEL